ncbi:snRNA-activating protein of 50kDa MW C terminal-domain-containing protein [Ostreococcus tauri]|uniref:snRNA-activating protein of 50kDa MW C terminal-domain-containing protein n=1 Tax=Ostreococcus tauri TaxID=70448 RepID=A0A1Y5IBV0_OSTTA|nr:snRNA-activating protein of 50kDa MW C terminal-domain-containing protein [Ostreococcus tauri]
MTLTLGGTTTPDAGGRECFIARHCPPEAPVGRPSEEVRAKSFCERASRSLEGLREACARAEQSARDAAKKETKTQKGGRGRGKKRAQDGDVLRSCDDVDMRAMRAMTIEKAVDAVMPTVPLPDEQERSKVRMHRGTGAKQLKLSGQQADERAERAKLVLKHLQDQMAAHPLASLREERVDVTRVMWKPRSLLDCELDASDPKARARADAGEKIGRTAEEIMAAPTGRRRDDLDRGVSPREARIPRHGRLLLGATPLVAFKDIIYCLRDTQAEREGHPTTKNGFLFIEGVFYNDMRTPNAVDYSAPLLEFQRKDKLMAPGAPTKMNLEGKGYGRSEVKDVPLVIGRPYVMTHQGKCEHKWRVRDIRIPHSADEKERNMFPLVIREGRIYRRGCSVCGVFDAAHVTYGDKMAAESPSFFCKMCFDAVHCDAQGNRTYDDYEEYPYDHE